jgi:DNA end-binding protein Ku
MAPRPNWKGYLKLSLVSCPVALYPATSSGERISFRQINKKTGNRLRQLLVDEGTREPVESHDKGRGYEVGKGQYLMIEDEEIEAIQVESSHTIEIDRFVPSAQIDKRYFDAPYYITPNDSVGQEAFAVIREAMKGKGMVALGRVVMAKRERVIALEPEGKGLLGMTLRYPYEVRETAAYFDEIPEVKIPGEMLKLAEHILDSKAGDFDPMLFEDHYENALVEMLKQRQAGVVQVAPASAPKPANVVSLMDALRRSIAEETRAATTGPKQSSKPKKRAGKSSPEELRKAPQFKLPIPGGKKKEAEDPAKAVPKPSRKRA